MSIFAILAILILLIILLISIFKGLYVQKLPAVGGDTGIIGAKGRCVKKYSDKEGKIFVNGEFWEAHFIEAVKENDNVLVVNVKDSKAIVKRITDSEENVY